MFNAWLEVGFAFSAAVTMFGGAFGLVLWTSSRGDQQ